MRYGEMRYGTKTIFTRVDCGMCCKPVTKNSTVPFIYGTYNKSIHWCCLYDFYKKELDKIAKEIAMAGRRNAKSRWDLPNSL